MAYNNIINQKKKTKKTKKKQAFTLSLKNTFLGKPQGGLKFIPSTFLGVKNFDFDILKLFARL